VLPPFFLIQLSNGMNKTSRILIALAALSLILTKFVPLWRIELDAPQYPEGLVMEIWTYKLAGDVDVVNGLNHYIGMATMHTEDFVEFKILPWLILFTTAFGVITALAGKKKLLYVYASWVVLFGVVSMVDFYKWEYDYGHNLDPNAPIQVPGMSYQPPFIGFKQLLNFGAYSIPDIGGFIFILNALVVVGVTFMAWKQSKTPLPNSTALIVAMMALTFQSCSKDPKPIQYGSDICDFCKMTIVDARFGGEIMLNTGKPFKFDDAGCIEAFLVNEYIDKNKVDAIYLTDYSSGILFKAESGSVILKSKDLKSPMGSNIAAFANESGIDSLQHKIGGTITTWDLVRPELHRKEAINGI
jgi:copper chaperone NosL